MAESVLESLYNMVKHSQVIGDVTNICCDSCVIVKNQLLQVFQELKSALLQEDIIKLKASASSNVTKSSQHSEFSALDQATVNCIPVHRYGGKKTNKAVAPVNKYNRQLITLSNRFTPLSDEQKLSVSSDTITFREVQHNKDKSNYNKKPSNRTWSKIIIIGDSHARGCSQVVKHNLDQNVDVQGIVKPGANIEVIVNTSTKTIRNFTKKDIVVVWGGSRDVGKNETDIELLQIKNFVENHSQTNFVVMSVPYRHDLDPESCINDEVKVYNRKLK